MKLMTLVKLGGWRDALSAVRELEMRVGSRGILFVTEQQRAASDAEIGMKACGKRLYLSSNRSMPMSAVKWL